MKRGGFKANSRPYQFFSKESAILNRLLKDNVKLEEGVFGILFNHLTKAVEG